MGKRSRIDDGSSSEPEGLEAIFPGLKRRGIAMEASKSIDFTGLPKSLDTEISDPDELLNILTPDVQTKLLKKLLADEALKPATLSALQSFLAEAVPKHTASIVQEVQRATARMRWPKDPRTARMVEFDAYPTVVEPYLEDVATVARLPVKGSAKAAFELLLELTADALMVVLAKRRKEEEGEEWQYGEVLRELEETMRQMEDELAMELEYPWMPETFALLESWTSADKPEDAKIGATTTSSE
ncbi:hypothetical protein ONZ51_g1075 [Trametes cubensis]|uniref:Uncharacterized protein n=1 Tax=Trametes cubensis TaxID=1111947 RepID=A0AAD7XF68_9APHY|nr:hypothetical protein ONZ51_g1075 [Trametes cubensis]